MKQPFEFTYTAKYNGISMVFTSEKSYFDAYERGAEWKANMAKGPQVVVNFATASVARAEGKLVDYLAMLTPAEIRILAEDTKRASTSEKTKVLSVDEIEARYNRLVADKAA